MIPIYIVIVIAGQPKQASAPYRQPTMRQFFNALRQVETGNQPYEGQHAVGDGGKAYGPYQIWHEYWEDSRVEGSYHQVAEKKYSERVMLAYWKRYCPAALKAKDYQTLARVHNGGPNGAFNKKTLAYWKKVKRELDKTAR